MIEVDNDKCLKCGGCVSVCPLEALELDDFIKCDARCNNCGICVKFCPVDALEVDD